MTNAGFGNKDVNITALVGQIVAMFLVFGLALFLPAGTVAWLPGWIFLVMFFGFVAAISLWLFRHDLDYCRSV